MFRRSKSTCAIVRKFPGLCLLILASTSLGACDLVANYSKADRAGNAEIQDYRDALAPRSPEIDGGESSSSGVPELQPYTSVSSEREAPMPLVSVSVNQTIPVRDIFYELAEQSGYDLELDPGITGSVIFTVKNKPLDQVVDRLCTMAGLRYEMKDSTLHVEIDTPYNKLYKLDFLNLVRSNSGSVSSSVSVVSGEGADSGSSFSSSSSSDSDFWGELDLAMTQILGGGSPGLLKTNADPQVTAVDQNPDVQAVAPQNAEGEGGAENADGGEPVAQPPEAVLNVQSLPEAADTAAASAGAPAESATFTFSINKQAGVINVFAPEAVQKKVAEYLDEVKKAVSTQVLVEAKVFEVALSDEYIQGVQWSAFSEGVKGVEFVSLNPYAPEIATTTSFAGQVFENEFQAVVEALSGFGTVRALASPRLTVMNNQSAVLTVATNRVFFELEVKEEIDEETEDKTLTIDSETKSVPEGVLINVQPSVDLEGNIISMILRPTVTRIVGTVADPGAQIYGVTSEIPEVNIQEIDTVLRVHSGKTVVMGGLLQDKSELTQEGVPVLGEVPVFGNFFKKKQDISRKTELVIFLKATIVNTDDDTIHNTDRDLYKAFAGDRRPLDI